jgi:hypothetical protein
LWWWLLRGKIIDVPMHSVGIDLGKMTFHLWPRRCRRGDEVSVIALVIPHLLTFKRNSTRQIGPKLADHFLFFAAPIGGAEQYVCDDSWTTSVAANRMIARAEFLFGFANRSNKTSMPR